MKVPYAMVIFDFSDQLLDTLVISWLSISTKGNVSLSPEEAGLKLVIQLTFAE